MRKNANHTSKSESFTANTVVILILVQFILSFLRACGRLSDWPMEALLLPMWIIIGLIIFYAALIIIGFMIMLYRYLKTQKS